MRAADILAAADEFAGLMKRQSERDRFVVGPAHPEPFIAIRVDGGKDVIINGEERAFTVFAAIYDALESECECEEYRQKLRALGVTDFSQ